MKKDKLTQDQQKVGVQEILRGSFESYMLEGLSENDYELYENIIEACMRWMKNYRDDILED